MKNIFFAFALAVFTLSSCSDDDPYNLQLYKDLDETTQNSYDDQAIEAYMDRMYITQRGKLTSNPKDVNDENVENRKLSDLNPQKLPSGVIYILFPNAQPTDGKQVNKDDYITLQNIGVSMRAIKEKDSIQFTAPVPFYNTIDGSGIPLQDPQWYHVKKSVLENAQKVVDNTDLNTASNRDDLQAATQRKYYEIEGFQEAIEKFKSFNLQASDNYNLQGIIIVPSRAAFGKDLHFNYSGISLKDNCFVFNFQLYNTRARTPEEE